MLHYLFLVCIFICLILLINYYFTSKSLTYTKIIDYIFLFFIVSAVYLSILFFRFSNLYGSKIAQKMFLVSGAPFPIHMITALTFVYLICQTIYYLINHSKLKKKELQQTSTLYAGKIIIDRWEKNAEDNEIAELYNNIIELQNGGNFYTEKEWIKKFPSIKYVDITSNNKKLRFISKFIQEMTDSVRIFDLENKYIINNKKDIQRSLRNNTDENLLGWFTSYRMWLSNDYVRNVWENTKYSYKSPEFSKWVQYFIIDPVENNPNFWIEHKKNWNKI